ncbi:hypothetical protein pb186bvf_004314 [Paramecium bursaria]
MNESQLNKKDQLIQCLRKISVRRSVEQDTEEQLRKFQAEVQQKYLKARHNHTYRFPHEGLVDSLDSSLDDLKDMTVYDLNCQPQSNTQKLLMKIMSEKQMKQKPRERQSQRFKTEAQDNTYQFLLDKFLKQKQPTSQEQKNDLSTIKIKSQHTSRGQHKISIKQHLTNHSHNKSKQSDLSVSGVQQLSKSFSQVKNRTNNYYINRVVNKSNEKQTSTSNSQQESKISLRQFFTKPNPILSNNASNLRNKLQEICLRQPLKTLK